MKIRNTYTRQSLRSLEEEWREILSVFQMFCTSDRRIMPDGTAMERVKIDSLSPESFLNCVSTIVERINNEFGAFEVKDLYDSLDKDIPHKNEKPQADAEEYDFCCNTFYERTIIFSGVYYIIAVQNPELTEVLSAIYAKMYYKDAHPYIDQFVHKLRHRNGSEDGVPDDIDEFIPPHIIPDIQALKDGYRHLSPRRQLYQFKRILASIDAIDPNELSPRIFTLRMVVDYTLTCLRRNYGLWEDQEYIPETEKVTIEELIKTLQKQFRDKKEAIVPFIQHLLNEKKPSAQDGMYLQMLLDSNETNSGNPTINISIENNFHKPVGTVIGKVEELHNHKES